MAEYDQIAEVRFRTATELENRYVREQIALLWMHMSKRRAENEATSKRINELAWSAVGIALSAVGILGAILFSIVRAKIGL